MIAWSWNHVDRPHEAGELIFLVVSSGRTVGREPRQRVLHARNRPVGGDQQARIPLKGRRTYTLPVLPISRGMVEQAAGKVGYAVMTRTIRDVLGAPESWPNDRNGGLGHAASKGRHDA